jgi:hypothetical protein
MSDHHAKLKIRNVSHYYKILVYYSSKNLSVSKMAKDISVGILNVKKNYNRKVYKIVKYFQQICALPKYKSWQRLM